MIKLNDKWKEESDGARAESLVSRRKVCKETEIERERERV